MADVKLIGGTFSDYNYPQSANYAELERHQAAKTGTLKYLKLYASYGGHIKAVIYADSSGSPGTRLAAPADQAITAGTRIITVPDTAIVAGNYYWVGHIIDQPNVVMGNDTGGTSKYKSQSYSGFSWPDPGSLSGFSSETATWDLVGWGEESAGGSVVPLLMSQYRRRRC